MVQLSPRTQLPYGAVPTAPLCRRARFCSRLTAARCFKGNTDDPGTLPLRLNFKLPYRVTFGQSIGMVGSGDTLGNWDPKQRVPMKWTDGDWWIAEVSLPSGTPTLDLEYKYVVVNADGNICYWKPGSNYRVTLPLPSSTKVVKRVKVADTWDGSSKKIDLEEAEALPSSSTSADAAQRSQGRQEAGPLKQQWRDHSQQHPAPASATAVPPPPIPSPPTFPLPETPTAPLPQPDAAQLSNAAQRVAEAKAPTNGAPVTTLHAESTTPANGSAAAASTASPDPQLQEREQRQQQQQQVEEQQAGTAAGQQAGALPRASQFRAAPPSFAAATTIPTIHPSLLKEEERLEDVVRSSLEDLQAQVDMHQQLRGETDELKPAVATAGRAADAVAALTKEVASLRQELAAMRQVLATALQQITALLRQPPAAQAGSTQQVFIAPAPPWQPFSYPVGQSQASMPQGWWQVPASAAEGYRAPAPDPAEVTVQPGQAAAPPAVPAATHAVVSDVLGAGDRGDSAGSPPWQDARSERNPHDRDRTAFSLRTIISRRQRAAPRSASAPVRSLGASVPAPAQTPQPSTGARDAPQARLRPASSTARSEPVRSAKAAASQGTGPVRAPAKATAASLAVLLPVVCGVGKGALQGARGQFNMQQYREAAKARWHAPLPACVELQAVKRQGTWSDVTPFRHVTPVEFLQEGGLRGPNWRASIRVLVGGEVGQPLGEVLQRAVDRVNQ